MAVHQPLAKPAYVASAWGARFHSLTTHEALGGGAAGGGKTLCLLMEPLNQIRTEHMRCQDPDFVPSGFDEPQPLRWGESKGCALFLRRVTPMLRQVVGMAKRLFPQIDPQVRWNERDNEFTFQSGYKYRFGHCKDKDDWWLYQGDELTMFLPDELTQYISEQYEQISARCRTDDPVLRKMIKIRAMSNPFMDMTGMEGVATDESPHWVRDLFVTPAPEGGEVLEREVELSTGEKAIWTRCYLPARLSDNPNKEFAQAYDLILSTKKPHIRKALRDGDWYVTAGSFFGEVWDPNLHIAKPFKIPDTWKRWRSMDWGFKSPGCIHWYAMDDDGTVWVEREFTFQNKTDVEVAKAVKEIETILGLWDKGKKRSRITGPADTQLWEQRGEVGSTKAEVFALNGVPWVQADKRSRATNAERLYKRLGDHQDGTKTPGIVFFTTCRDAITTIPGIMTDPGMPECPVDGGPDHWYDSVVYSCAYASRGLQGIPSVQRESDDDYDDDVEVKRKRGKLGYGGY